MSYGNAWSTEYKNIELKEVSIQTEAVLLRRDSSYLFSTSSSLKGQVHEIIFG